MNTSCSIKKLKETKKSYFDDAIVFSVDTNYLPFAIFVANQIIELEPNLSLDICICTTDIKAVPKKFYDSKIRFVEIEVNGLDNLPCGRLSASAYHRLFLPDLFAEDYRYLIYLDADTFILKPFTEDLISYLNKLDPCFSIAAAADICELQHKLVAKSHRKKINKYLEQYHQCGHIYRNSGVLALNVKSFLKNNTLDRVIQYAFNKAKELRCHDQSAINGALNTEIALLPFTYNWQVHKLTFSLINDYNPYIIHFIGENKPWNTMNTLTREYTSSYDIFFKNNFFAGYNLEILTPYQKRSKNPKYPNIIRETISKQNEKFKNILTQDRSKLSLNKRKKVIDALNSQQFIINN